MKIDVKLNFIQTKLHAPKGQKNMSLHYSYRSAEDILEAVKPLLDETGCSLILNDEIVFVEGRFYVKSTAMLRDDSDETVSVSAYAREATEKRGIDEAQVTGLTSSYARKYALNGLFAIDDNKDSDFDEETARRQPVAQGAQRPAAAQSAKPAQSDAKKREAPQKPAQSATSDSKSENASRAKVVPYEEAITMVVTVPTKGGGSKRMSLGEMKKEQLIWLAGTQKGETEITAAIDAIFERRMDEEDEKDD